MTAQEEYKVRLDVFEGPLDLLLYLIRREEVDIYDIPIERITQQYLQYLDLMRMLDLNIAGEFLVMAATLMMIKSRMLLPAEERPALEEDGEEEVDPRWDLVRRLVEYKKFKDAAHFLEQLELGREGAFAREGDVVALAPEPELALQDVGVFDLISAFHQALQRVRQEELREIFSERYTVPEKIDELLGLVRDGGEIRLVAYLAGMRSKHEIVVTFLAVLELIRLRQLTARQDRQFGEILLVGAPAA
jgi:segregation and condensation protein A